MNKILCILILIVLFMIGLIVYQETKFNKQPIFKQKSKLININFKPTRHEYITVWECGEFGNLACDDRDIFTKAKPISVLLLKKLDNRVEIIGIE